MEDVSCAGRVVFVRCVRRPMPRSSRAVVYGVRLGATRVAVVPEYREGGVRCIRAEGGWGKLHVGDGFYGLGTCEGWALARDAIGGSF